MAHGQPDFGMYSVAATIYRLADMGELAARLGSIVTFDRRGDIVWLDDFEGDVDKWLQLPYGDNSEIVLSPDAARNGSFSAKLTTGDETNDYCRMRHYSLYPVSSRIGFEISFTCNDDLSYLYVSQRLYDGSYEHYARLLYLPPTDVLQYLDENEKWQDLVTDLDLSPFNYVFHTVKLVIDLESHKYVRAILNDVEYDMSALSYYRTEDTTTRPDWEQEILTITGADSNESIHVDDAIVTQNEP